MHDVLRFWLDRGADGFRRTSFYRIGKDPQLRDNEPDLRHDQDWPTIHDRLRRIRAVIDSYDRRMLSGEVYLLDLRRLVEYINTGDELHLAHNSVFCHLPWRAAAFRASVQQFADLAEAAWPAWFLENHDHSRVATRYADAPENGQHRARVAAMMICTLRGTPFLYYGRNSGCPMPRYRRNRWWTSTAGTRSGCRCHGASRPGRTGRLLHHRGTLAPRRHRRRCLCVEAQEKDAPGPDRPPTTKPPDLGMWPTGSLESMG